MEYRKCGNDYVIRLEKDEEITEQLTKFCQTEQIKLGTVQGLGAAKSVEIGLFNTETKEYITTVFNGMYEITSLLGNISQKDNNVYLHNHINFSDMESKVYGGHMVKCVISATCEIIIHKIDGEVNRKFNEEIGLNLFEF